MSARARGRRGRHLAEATAIGGLMLLFAALPPARASDLGGWLGRRLGPRLGRLHRRARANLARALPELDRPARARILAAMWTDLGRVAGEYPHLARIAAGRVGTQDRAEGGAELRSRAGVALVVDPRAAPHLAPGRPAILIAAHLANWELLPFVARRQGVRLAVLMRPPDNPHIARLLARLRRRGATAQLTKSRAGARAALTTLAAGGKLGVLIDQKLREGEPVPFFGRPAPTAPHSTRWTNCACAASRRRSPSGRC